MLLAMTLILLPVLPNRPMGPFGAINPYELWLMTILIAVVSSAGYIAMKWGSPGQGVMVSGVAGGLVSSTAVTLAFSRLAREHPERLSALVAGTLLAGMTMMLRILFVVSAIDISLLRWLLLPLVFAALGTAAFAAWHMRQAQEQGELAPLELTNPFELPTVLKFGAFLAVIMVVAKLATAVAGGWGALGLAAASGLADVDAITLTMSRMGSIIRDGCRRDPCRGSHEYGRQSRARLARRRQGPRNAHGHRSGPRAGARSRGLCRLPCLGSSCSNLDTPPAAAEARHGRSRAS
jgi:uncharacterized membrane protein (DUF4010 family)